MGLALKHTFVSVLVASAVFSYQTFAELSWNGFGSAYYGQAFDSDLMPSGFEDKKADFTHFSLMGLNLSASVEEELSFAAQLVALGDPIGTHDSFGLFAQWAYLNYQPADGTSLRIGRQLYPSLMASEYVRVAYLLPFRQIPNPFSDSSPFTRFDGVSVHQAWDIGLGRLSLNLFGGKPLLDVNTNLISAAGLTFIFEDLLGAQVVLDGEGWRIRAQASRFYTELQTSSPLPTSTLAGMENTYSLGYRMDKFNIVSWGEYVWTRTPDGTITSTGRYAEQSEAYYILLGYRLGKFLPRYTFARAAHEFNLPGSTRGAASAHTLGVNYQAGMQTVIKVEFEVDVVRSAGDGGYYVTQPTGATATSGEAIYAGVDFIF